MSHQSMSCADERQLGCKLAKALGLANTQASFEDNNYNPQKILQTALAELSEKGGLDVVLTNALKGPAWWAYIVLRFGPDLGGRREEFLTKATQDPKAAFHTLKFVPDLGSHRDALLASTTKDPGWASSTLRHIPDLGPHAEALRMAVTAPPVEVGPGYNTYFVNQSGVELWVSYNTGMKGTSGSITGPHQLNIGQNVGWGRGIAVISETRVWTSNPADWSSNVGFLASWDLPQGSNGAKSWGFRINSSGIVEVTEWYSGGMPDEYPPSNGQS